MATRPLAPVHTSGAEPGRWRQRDWSAAALALPGVAGLALFTALPLALSVCLSFTNERLLPRPIDASWVGLANYQRLLGDSEFWQAALNTLAFTAMVLPAQLALALGAALLLNSQLRCQALLRGLTLVPLLLPMTVVCVLWAALLQSPDGMLNSIYQWLSGGRGYLDWLGDAKLALLSIALLSVWAAFPFQALIYLAGLQEIPQRHYEAAAIEGFSAWQRLRFITLPGLRQVHIFVIVVTVVGALGLFTQVSVLTDGGPNGATTTVIKYLYDRGYAAQQIGLASAVATLFFAVVGAVALATRAALKRI